MHPLASPLASAPISSQVQERKLSLIRAACERLRLSCVAPRAADATDAAALLALLQEQGREAADSIVLDAPCSGFGTLRRNPEHRSQGASHLAGLQALQGRLLEAAATRLKPGGSLTYSVCTPLVGECDAQIEAFLARHPHFCLETIEEPSLQPYVGECGVQGERTCVRTWTHTHECDSFFAAKLRRDS